MIGDYFNSESTTSEDLSANLNANDDGNSVSSDQKNIEQAEDEETDVNVSTESPTQNTVDEEKESLLELEFNAVAWVDIQNAQKEKVVYQSFPRGEKHQIKADLPLNIFIDNAESVFLRYEGRLIDLKPYIDEGYAKFTLSE